MRALLMSLLVLGLASSAACHRAGGVNSRSGVQEAIEEHLRQRTSGVAAQNMTMEIGEVTFSGDTAQAQVTFRSKQPPNVSVGVVYKLHKVGDGWQVDSASAASMHGSNAPGGAPMPNPHQSAPPPGAGPQPSH